MSFARFLELVRFGTVTVLGLTVDLAIAWALAVIFHVSFPVAAAAGFGFGALLNYLFHGRWTFDTGRAAFSVRRVASYAVVLAVVLSVRITSVAFFIWIIEDSKGYELAVLMSATGASFVANYLLSKYVVFRAGDNVNMAQDRFKRNEH